jgi:hypothetical protein
MKAFMVIAGLLCLILAACESLNEPISSSGFDPLRPPGSEFSSGTSSEATYKPGEFVTAAINNTAFYFKKPRGEEDADKLLKQGTQMKVVAESSSFLKVELDSGEVGFVPTLMISLPLNEMIPVEGIYEVYPPLPDVGGVEPLPLVDPSELPPDGSIPTIIDPDAPVDNTTPTLDTVPDIKPAEEEKKVEDKPKEEVKPEVKPEEPKPDEVKPSEPKPE